MSKSTRDRMLEISASDGDPHWKVFRCIAEMARDIDELRELVTPLHQPKETSNAEDHPE